MGNSVTIVLIFRRRGDDIPGIPLDVPSTPVSPIHFPAISSMTRINVPLRVFACACALAAPTLCAGPALAQANRPASLERELAQPTRDGALIVSVRLRNSPSGSEPAESEDANREKPVQENASAGSDSTENASTSTNSTEEESASPAEKPADEPSPNGVDNAAAEGEAAAEPAPRKTLIRSQPNVSKGAEAGKPPVEGRPGSRVSIGLSDNRNTGDKTGENAGDNAGEKTGETKDSQEPRTLENTPDAVAVPAFEQDLTPELVELRERVRKTLAWYYNEPISVNNYSPWGIMHALIAFGVDTQVYNADQKVNAIGWLCYNRACRGQRLMYLEDGKLRVDIGVGVQGHAGQFLAMLAQSRVRTDFPIKVEGRDFTVADLIESEKQTCRAKTELTFKLIALAHYLKSDATWKSDIGEEWSIPRLIKEELAQPVVGSACGGTHRMTGFSYAVNKRTKLNEPFEGQWLRGRQFVHAFHDYIFKLQNSDGSFSTNWFAGRGDSGEIKRHLETTGHMLEWLVCSLPSDQLDDPRVIKAVDHLTSVFEYGMRNGVKWEIGPRGHGLHALALYAERRFGDKPGNREAIFARRNSTKAVVR
jgi:hypothetical protein